jgi:probable rRNA maturation factor
MGPEEPPRRALRVTVSDERGRGVARGASLARWLVRVAPSRAHGSVAIALVADRRMRQLNRRYRRRDYATDVLSFPADPAAAPIRRSRPLGDIVIARGVARRQAREAGHPEGAELRLLALHGLLHLLGYDHERDRGEMARAEQRLRKKGGLSAGLIERAGRNDLHARALAHRRGRTAG